MIKRIFVLPLISAITIFLMDMVSAHCPLCTIGAGAAAGAAVWLGISKIAVMLFLGAFALSMGIWFSKIVKKQYIPFQKTIIALVIFLTTFIPLLPLFSVIGPLYIPFVGEYGTTYAFNYSILSGLFGSIIVFFSPSISRKLTEIRGGKKISYQGVILTLVMLIIFGGMIQILL